ncbi:TM1266 family iron-only hydrogenase system putative regulator [Peptostreptococcus porci]|uniref:TM1266 family iron-only hydrogenase system putative regulator n=1 Tax=Peptostreptococcus porci TaxID=2652282 RepID=UPI002A747A9B|nr:TM1266 family iron-only hydrogenase system putative regulator [Peptostreptococcus porci]MDY2795103.1 TM1266 family iron-only hydrogenase system putative regulator [Peptostreptococcus porci]MDY4129500.1 TM1266 family iron-only hydrogenase system putative regulator [Peptostreptococcus porci]MDY4560388.1 TM1266 family iron-only hydrogenase system putative regulator [Peptostreptococcus porci]MDY5436721.1 TM1266 family iron-only hydrogenase system putative regulator [Peptostreptococcus porci]MDY
MEKRVAVISAVLDNPVKSQSDFNSIVSEYKDIVRGRMGLPFPEEGISVVSITVIGTMDDINELTGKIGAIDSVSVKAAVSKKELA